MWSREQQHLPLWVTFFPLYSQAPISMDISVYLYRTELNVQPQFNLHNDQETTQKWGGKNSIWNWTPYPHLQHMTNCLAIDAINILLVHPPLRASAHPSSQSSTAWEQNHPTICCLKTKFLILPETALNFVMKKNLLRRKVN